MTKEQEQIERAKQLVKQASVFVEKDQLSDPAVKGIIAKAEALLKDARILADHGSIRTATGLAVLSFEESSKAVLVRWGKFGLIDQELHKKLDRHEIKQTVFQKFIFASGLMRVAREIGDKAPEFTKGGEDGLKRLWLFLVLGGRIGDNDGGTIKEGLLTLANYYSQLKEAAFYIDVSEAYELASEVSIEEKDLKHVLENAEKAIEMAKAPNNVLAIMGIIAGLAPMGKPRRWKDDEEKDADLARIQKYFQKIVAWLETINSHAGLSQSPGEGKSSNPSGPQQ